jgi:UDP-N-acetylmuramoyl-L-alanyl-D-glutamate--2,6-diaminopimelate ligase
MKKILKKITPPFLLKIYHFTLAILAAIIYRFPSQKMIVIGVTGTGGKSTTVKMIGRILEENNYPVGWLSSLTIKISRKEIVNPFHMTMLGRFQLQKSLRQMIEQKKRYAIIEVTSEGIKQFRHLGINFDALVFTNLSPEHIEAHGGFENYRATKLKIFQRLARQKKKKLPWLKKPQDKVIIANLDNKHASYFLNNPADKIYAFSLSKNTLANEKICLVKAQDVNIEKNSSSFVVNKVKFKLHLLGQFNIYNALAAITTTYALGIKFNLSQKALAKIKKIAGRLEKIPTSKNFNIIIDLAHTPDSLRQVYRTLQKSYLSLDKSKKMICVFGSAGGVRDKWKRPVMGEIAAQYCDKIYLTNEDPYQENPTKIIADIEQGVKKQQKREKIDYFKIEDRRQAIRQALKATDKGDVIALTGKGTEATMVIGEKKIPWNEKKVVQEEVKAL